MAIKLDIIKPSTRIEEALKAGYLYKDVLFDIKQSNITRPELHSKETNKDIGAIYDSSAIINSIKNILTTSPGQKLLNPLFGLDLREFLFDPITETRAFFIGERILYGLGEQEPRITVESVDVVAAPEDMEYIITIEITIPTLNVFNISLKGVLNNDGYTFV